MQLRTRLAPTPSGYLHAGNAYSFVLTWLQARSANGRILLRIDDLDATRKRPEYVEDIFASIDWLGLDYDEGPTGPSHFEREFSQKHRIEQYRSALQRLRSAKLLFPCSCSRSSIAAAGGEHPASCRDSNTSFDHKNVAWRITTQQQTEAWTDADEIQRSVTFRGSMTDFVVRRKDNVPAYQIASLVDDVHFDINFVVRGEDLLESTAAQHFLARHLGFHGFLEASFLHHALLTNPDGTKLSKSAGASSLRSMRECDPTATQFFQQISARLNLPEAAMNARDALAMWKERSNDS